ncbi:MAG: sulfatase-like hydrolase/transferase [Saprospiraceae bacterium]|nr:sulfatase-like hydrolase/transferase [Saprospiraceae bacterium]
MPRSSPLPPADLHKFTNLTGTATDIRDKPKKYFKAMIQAMDRKMGRLFDSLKVMNKLDSTDIIFIGDNGNSTRTAQIADQNKAKGTVYEYGVNVPMIISGPTVVNKGRISDALVNTADLFATIVENFGYRLAISNTIQ